MDPILKLSIELAILIALSFSTKLVAVQESLDHTNRSVVRLLIILSVGALADILLLYHAISSLA